MEDLKKNIHAIIFDMDGTIIQTEHIWQRITIDALKQHGITQLSPENLAFMETLSGISLKIAALAMKKHFDLQCDPEHLVKLSIELAGKYFLENKIEFIEGFELFHNKLQNINMPTSIATNADPISFKKLAKKLKLKRYFGQNMYTMAHVNNTPKPDPSIFLHAVNQLGVKPENCVVFEDSIYGFQAAKAAGMKCIAIKNKNNKHLTDQVDRSIENYHEAEDALKSL